MNSVSKSQWCILASYYFCCCRCLKATNKFSCKKKTFIWLLLFFYSFCAIACTICADRIHDICFWIHALARCAYAYSNIWCYRLKSFMIVIISWLSSTLVNDGFSGFGIYFFLLLFYSPPPIAYEFDWEKLYVIRYDPTFLKLFQIFPTWKSTCKSRFRWLFVCWYVIFFYRFEMFVSLWLKLKAWYLLL